MTLGAIINTVPNLFDIEVPTTNHADKLNETLFPGSPLALRPTVHIPSRLSGPLVWSGEELHDSTVYSLDLTTKDFAEIDKALGEFKGETDHFGFFLHNCEA
jgi:hypothetical protein